MTRKSPRAADEHRNEQGQLEEPNPPFAVQHQNSPGLEAKLDPQPRYEAEAYKAAGKWNTYEITAIGSELTVKFNGVVTVHTANGKFKEGPITLQYGAGPKGAPGGTIRWRKVEIKEL